MIDKKNTENVAYENDSEVEWEGNESIKRDFPSSFTYFSTIHP
jgi:hypothetical protein